MFGKIVKPFHNTGDVHKAQQPEVELIKVGGFKAKNLYALEEVFCYVACFVAVPVQEALLFAVALVADDELHALRLEALDNLIRIKVLVSHKRLGLQPIEQLRDRFGVVPLAWESAQSTAGCPARRTWRGFGVKRAAHDADDLRAVTLARAG